MSEKILALGEEYPPEGEELLIEQILNIIKFSMEHRPHPPTLRDQHPKSHGYVSGEFILEQNIPDDFKVGIFAEKPSGGNDAPAKTYPIWIRFSNGSSDGGRLMPDTIGDVRGMAIKLMSVEGEKALDDPSHQGEQDFILMNNSTFFIRDVQGYIDFFPVVKAIKEGTITFNPDGTPKRIPDDLKESFQRIAYALQLVQRIKQKQTSSPLEIPYWSATPYKFGEKAMKFSVVPHATDQPFNRDLATDKDNYLREAMTKHLNSRDAYFDFKIQLQTDVEKMPIEDSTIEWSEQESPYIKVATIKIPQQDFNSKERKQLDEKQSFSPWYSLREYRPLGGVNRTRKFYAELARIRNEKNRT